MGADSNHAPEENGNDDADGRPVRQRVFGKHTTYSDLMLELSR
jgi:hypothetical protein